MFFTIVTIGIIAAIWSASFLKIESNIYSILPNNSDFEQFRQIANESFPKNVLFAVDIEGLSHNESFERLDTVSVAIDELLSKIISDQSYDFSKNQISFLDHYTNDFYYFIDEADYLQLESRLCLDSIRHDIKNVASQLSSINSIFLKNHLLNDPLGVTHNKLNQLRVNSDSSTLRNQDGLLVNTAQKQALIKAQLIDENASANDLLSIEQELLNLKSKLHSRGIEVDYFAPFLFANANARTIKKDTKTTLLITVILLVILLLYYYKNLGVSLFFIVSVILSSIFGLGVTSLFLNEISGLAIAASSVLLGIIVDYSFHIITHYSKELDIRDTIKTVSKPLLIGSFTTVVAFASLMMTESGILKDFGLLALCTLTCAALVNLIILPQIIDLIKLKIKTTKRNTASKIPRFFKRLVFAAALVSCVLFMFSPPKVTFDKDITKLGYYPENLIELEERITGLNPKTQKRLVLFNEDESLDSAIQESKLLFDELSLMKTVGVSQISSVASFAMNPHESNVKSKEWNEFWKPKRDSVRFWIDKSALEFGFNEGIFSAFSNSLDDVTPIPSTSMSLLEDLELDHLITQSGEKYRVATSVVVLKDSLDTIKARINSLNGVFIFDTSELASSLLSSVRADFNYLLIFTTLLVFMSLLLIYGRIELALFSFLPMVLIWIWVLYIAQIFGINFNLVNVLLATIIFGLGDDYSIFVTDGLLKKYKSNEDTLKTFRRAIVLSALTTTIGTGALYFAVHPGINSIAVLSVVGMLSIILVTMVVQPVIFDIFILNRVKNKRTPITLAGLFISLFALFSFFIGCLVMSILAGLFFFIPVKIKSKRKTLNFLISRLARFLLIISFHLKKEQRGFNKLDLSSPSILISNHTSFLDIIIALSLSHKITIVAKGWVSKTPVMGFVLRHSGHICIDQGIDQMMEAIQSRVNDGYSILLFPEGTRSPDGELGRFHKGAFLVSKTFGIDIQPILITGCEFISPKGDFIIKKGKITTHILDRIRADDPILNERLGVVSKEIKNQLSLQLDELRKVDYNLDFMGNRISYNYLYKGPILEWYFKIKWRIEKKNYAYFNETIGDRNRIYDLGGGYGYLSFFLHYSNESRRITSIDYDEEKVNIAKHSVFKTDNLDFYQKKVEDIDLENFDACILYDVLHYISPEKRVDLFRTMSEKINPDGIIIIRDAISNFKESHKKTKLTEFFSTKVFNFNKSTNDLSFMSLEELDELSRTFNLTYELNKDSMTLSNLTIVFKKAS